MFEKSLVFKKWFIKFVAIFNFIKSSDLFTPLMDIIVLVLYHILCLEIKKEIKEKEKQKVGFSNKTHFFTHTHTRTHTQDMNVQAQ